jgi:hypothetical protein
MIDVLRRALAVIAREAANADARTEMIAALAALVTFGVTFITLYTVSDERLAVLFAIFLAVILRRSLQQEGVTQNA